MACGAFLLASANAASSVLFVVVSLMLLTTGLGATTPLSTIIAQNAAAYQQLGVVTAFSQFIRQIGAALGVALVGAFVLHQSASHIPVSALTQVIDQAYLFCAIVLVLVVIANLFLKEIPLRTENVANEGKL